MRVWMYPKNNAENKYNSLFSDSLENIGIEVKDFSWSKILELRKEDIFHIHWIYGIYQSKSKVVSIIKLILMLCILTYLKIKKVKIVWTVHNLYPHKYYWIEMESLARSIFAKKSDALIVASKSIKNSVFQEFNVPKEKIYIVPHGHYVDVYKSNGVNYKEKLGIPNDNYVFMFIGQIKAYKGVLELIKEYRDLQLNNTTLLVVGKPSENFKDILLKEAKNDPNIKLDLRFIPDEEMADIIAAGDSIVLPYKEITTSGSVILSLSFMKPLIAPETEFMREYLGEDTGIFYDNNNSDGLKNALLEMSNKSWDESAFKKRIEMLNWSNIADLVKDIYSSL